MRLEKGLCRLPSAPSSQRWCPRLRVTHKGFGKDMGCPGSSCGPGSSPSSLESQRDGNFGRSLLPRTAGKRRRHQVQDIWKTLWGIWGVFWGCPGAGLDELQLRIFQHSMTALHPSGKSGSIIFLHQLHRLFFACLTNNWGEKIIKRSFKPKKAPRKGGR